MGRSVLTRVVCEIRGVQDGLMGTGPNAITGHRKRETSTEE